MPIKKLDKDTANKIAAGEVITDPAAVIKELVENSIDANSTRIDISIIDGGKKNISIMDNGDGIISDEVHLAFERHATSKIKQLHDLYELTSLGFRGEALPSVAAISKITMKTQSQEEELGTYVNLVDHQLNKKRRSYSKGTSITVEDLFYNTPARLKHLKKANELSKDIIELIEHLAFSHPNISFSLTVDGKTVIKTPGDDNLLNGIYSIFGSEFGDSLIPIQYENKPLSITGYLGKSNYTRKNRKHQYIYINNRYIQDSRISKAIEEAYDSTIMINQHPVFVINIQVPPHMLDVNVHPSKTKIKILNESLILLLIKDGIRKKLRDSSMIKNIEPKVNSIVSENEEYIQEEMISPFPKKEVTNIVNKNTRFLNQEISKSTSKEGENPLEDSTSIKKSIREDTKEVKQNNVVNESRLSLKEEGYNLGLEFSQNFKNTNLIGQLFSTYILFEGKDFILLMDQHAAHERVLYEDISSKLKNGDKATQQIFPVNIQLSPSEKQLLLNHEELFAKIGFEFDEFGNNTICVRGVPIFLNKVQESNLLLEIVEELDIKIDLDYVLKFEEAIIKSACKKAVKGNNKLSLEEIRALIDQLIACDYPYTCPHGRPTLLRLTKYEFEKQFKRIQ